MQKYFNNVTNRQGGAVSGVSVKVTSIDGSVAVLFSDNARTQMPNPMVTGPNGDFAFYADNGRYNLSFSGSGITSFSLTDLLLQDILGPASATVLGGIKVGSGLSISADGTLFLLGANVKVSPFGQIAANYTMTFQDEFDGTALDTTKWNDYYWGDGTNPNPVNYDVANGNLRIWPNLNSAAAFYNRHMTTKGKFSQLFGFFEWEARMPIGQGVWPALWMLYSDNPGITGAEPEIDVMECYPGDTTFWADANRHPNKWEATYFDIGANQTGVISRSQVFPSVDLSLAFHKYGVKWTATTLTFYMDGVMVGTVSNVSMPKVAGAIQPMYPLVSLQMFNGQGPPASPTNQVLTPTGQSNALLVNYVRVWSSP